MYIVYVDSLHGLDTNKGDLLNPVASILVAYNKVYNGGVIVLSTGNGSSYGSLNVTKNVSIVAAEGSFPIVDTINYSNAQGLVRGLYFRNISEGIKVTGLNYGAIVIRNCFFDNVEYPISLNYLNYISIHRNFFYNYKIGISINTATEVNLSSNIFSMGYRALSVVSINRIDFWRNTIYGSSTMSYLGIPDKDLRVVYKVLTYFDLSNKRIQIPGRAAQAIDGKYDVALNIVNGPSFNYGIDYIVIGDGTIISWEGLSLEDKFVVGDMIRIMYSEDEDIEAGEAVRLQNIGDANSRIDSNSISGTIVLGLETPVNTGVLSNTPVKVRYNNFDMVNKWWDGFVPTNETGINNIGETALYVDPNNNNFRLKSLSPNINKGDPDRWNNILEEMGITRINGSYTMCYTGIRENIAPFDNDIDYDGFYRGVTGINNQIGDIGSFEYNEGTTGGNYIGEFGYDYSYKGTETAPYFTIDKGFKESDNKVVALVNDVPIEQNDTILSVNNEVKYARFFSRNLILKEALLSIGDNKKNDTITIYQDYSKVDLSNYRYVAMNGNDITGDGSIAMPYRTISRAIQDNPKNIVVEPGVYPNFKGATGINIVSIEKLFEIETEKKYCEIDKQAWTGINFRVLIDGLYLDNSSDVLSKFNVGDYTDIKFNVNVVSDKVGCSIFNSDNELFFVANKEASYISYGYKTDGSVYSINYPVIFNVEDTFSNIKVRFLIKQDRFYIYINNKYINVSYSNYFISGLLSNWFIRYYNTSGGNDSIFKMNIYSNNFSGVTGMNYLYASRKVFSIIGDTGLNNE